MATTTVRLDPEEEHTLSMLAETHGGRSNVLRQGLRLVAAESQRRIDLEQLLREWDASEGVPSDEAVARMAKRFDL